VRPFNLRASCLTVALTLSGWAVILFLLERYPQYRPQAKIAWLALIIVTAAWAIVEFLRKRRRARS
jgi:hypothetical protein